MKVKLDFQDNLLCFYHACILICKVANNSCLHLTGNFDFVHFHFSFFRMVKGNGHVRKKSCEDVFTPVSIAGLRLVSLRRINYFKVHQTEERKLNQAGVESVKTEITIHLDGP